MVLDSGGQVIAIFAGNDRVGSSAVPVGDFSRQLEPIVREKAVDRPYLGVHYLDLAQVLGGEERRGGQEEGALLLSSADGKRPAVVKGSPAAEVGLRAGDLILAVNGESVSAKRSLAEIVSQYRADDSLVLTVLRGAFSGGATTWQSTGRTGAKIDITVDLERLPSTAK
jgi:S1-C subfamily serine protease